MKKRGWGFAGYRNSVTQKTFLSCGENCFLFDFSNIVYVENILNFPDILNVTIHEVITHVIKNLYFKTVQFIKNDLKIKIVAHCNLLIPFFRFINYNPKPASHQADFLIYPSLMKY